MSTELMRYDIACRAVAEANSIDEIKDIKDKAEAMRLYARQAQNKQLEADAGEIRFRAERRLGEMLSQSELAKGGRPPKETPTRKEGVSPTLAEVGISYKLSSRSKQLAAIPEEEFEGILGGWRDRVSKENERVSSDLLKAADNHRAMGTGENEWYTPIEYIEAAREVMGEIDLDPATSEQAQSGIQATQYYTEGGLYRPWIGRVWLNPPYSQPAISDFVARLVSHVKDGLVEEAILLTHNYTDTKWFHLAESAAEKICFTRGRIAFLSPAGVPAAPTQGQAFFYYGSDGMKFKKVFVQFGFVR
jgi:phage N-6-adenine-methyltransferase